MSHVTDKAQKVPGTLLLSNHKSNVHHHTAMREIKANINHAHLYLSQQNEGNVFLDKNVLVIHMK